MTGWQDRVIKERDELKVRVERLEAFVIGSVTFTELGKAEQDRLRRQLTAMWGYLGVLDERIAAFNTAGNDTEAASVHDELIKALDRLVCCPAFTGALFERDKQSHYAWTLARKALADAKGVRARADTHALRSILN